MRFPFKLLTRSRWVRIQSALSAYDKLVADLMTQLAKAREPADEWASAETDSYGPLRAQASAKFAAWREANGMPLIRHEGGIRISPS